MKSLELKAESTVSPLPSELSCLTKLESLHIEMDVIGG